MNRRSFLATTAGAFAAGLLLKKSIVATALPAGPLRGKMANVAMLDEFSYHGTTTGRWSGIVSHNVNWDLAVLSLYPHVLEVTHRDMGLSRPVMRLVRRNSVDLVVDTSTPSQEVTQKIFKSSLVWSQSPATARNHGRPEYTVIKSRWWTNPRKDGRVSREKLLELFTECMQQHVHLDYSFPGNYMMDGMTASDRELWRAALADPQAKVNRQMARLFGQEFPT